ncbi:MAG TPA: DUF5723 family protein [Paludibacter sp.]
MPIKRFIRILVILILSGLIRLSVRAQQVNSLYFMENVPVRHYLNPSFQPVNDFYLSLPVIGFSQLDIGNNSIALKDFIYKQNGQTITFLNPQGNVDHFYNVLKRSTIMHADFQTNLLAFGFRNKDDYWTFSVSEKVNGMLSLPKDLFKLSFYGTPDILSNSYNFTTLQTDISVYTEAAVGLSRKIDEQWTVGGKLKFLYGSANFLNTNRKMNLKAGIDKWTVTGNGSVNLSSPIEVNIGANFQSFAYRTPTKLTDWLKPSGIGAGVDFGAEYKLNEKIRLSGAILDLGFINWTRNVHNYQYGIDYSFDGVRQFDSSTGLITLQDVYNRLVTGQLTDSLVQLLKSSTTSELTMKTYLSGTTAKLNLAAEYGLLNNILSFGLLSSSRFSKRTVTEEITASLNARPYKWLNGTLSYSVFNGRMSSVGVGMGIKTGFVNWFLSADYIPFQKITLALSDVGLNSQNKIVLPYNTTTINFSAGVNLVFDGLITKVKSRKMQTAKKLGLRNLNPKVTRKTSTILPDQNKISRNRTRIGSDGLNKKNPTQDCHCDWK